MARTVLIIGNCGVGKTWVMTQLIKHLHANNTGKVGKYLYHRSCSYGALIVGKYDGTTFQRSDSLSMSIMTDNDRFKLATKSMSYIIVEGDRFMNKTFIKDFKPYVIHISGTGEEGRKNRKSKQSEQHLKRIASRVLSTTPSMTVNNSDTCFNVIMNIVRDNYLINEIEDG